MELILVKPIKELGQIGNLVKVKNGFGRNWLIPQGFAIRANEKNKQLIEVQKHELEEKNNNAKIDADVIAKKIDGKDLIFIRQSAADGRLFGSVNNKEVAKELSAIASTNIPYAAVYLEAPLKTIGVFHIEINLHHDVAAYVTVVIARSESEAQDALRNKNISNDDVASDAIAEYEETPPAEEA